MAPDRDAGSGDAQSVGPLVREGTLRLRAGGSESARLDAELILCHVLGVDRATLLGAPEAIVSSDQRRRFDELLDRRDTGEPVAYIRGLKEFYGLVLTVDRRALIPRPETELLVDLALTRLADMLGRAARPAGTAPLHVWDVGTGSGAIVIALASEARRRGYSGDLALKATDASADAIALAIENAVAHGVADLIEFEVADLLVGAAPDSTDMIAANLPYIPTDVVPTLPRAASFEPSGALDGGVDGLSVIERLLDDLASVLRAGGVAFLEIGADQGAAIEALAGEGLPGWVCRIHADLGGRPRVAELTRADGG